MTLFARSSLVLGFVLFVGCSRDTGVLTGTVTFGGKPVTNGMVAVRTGDGRAANGNIENGTYRIETAPVGKVQLTVQTFPPSPAVLPPGSKGDSVKLPPAVVHIPLPDRYNDFATSNLSTTVNPGENKLDLKLEK